MTALAVYGVPGQEHSFSPKDPAAAGDKGEGDFTQLSTIATPGKILQFAPKDPATPPSGKPSDQVTTLQTTATPGKLYLFTPKDAAPEAQQEGGGDIYYSRLHEELREEEEILGIIQAFLHTRG